jgi:hypothetical protein
MAKDIMDRIEAGVRREQEAAIAALAARGLPPAERSTVFSPHADVLNYGFRWLDDSAGGIEIRIETRLWDHATRKDSPHKEIAVWGRHWPGYGVTAEAGALLAFLASAWPVLASDFLKVPAARNGIVDFRAGIGRPDLPRFEIAVRGRELEIVADGGACRPGAEGLMALESLLTLGDELSKGLAARGLHGDATAAWSAARALDDLPPAEAEHGDFAPSAECILAGARFFARRLGIPLGTYTDVALYEASAHRIWYDAGRHGTEPRGGDGFRAVVLGTLPPPAEVRRMAEAARRVAVDPGPADAAGWELDALNQANIDARAMTFYHGWPARRPPMPIIPAGVDPASLVGKRLRTADGGGALVVDVSGRSAVGEPLLRVRFDRPSWLGGPTDCDWGISIVIARLEEP